LLIELVPKYVIEITLHRIEYLKSGTLYKNGESIAQNSPWWFPSDHTCFFEAEIPWPTVE
jgi:hypothetical protein